MKRKRPTLKLLALSFLIASVLGLILCLWWVYVGVTDDLCELRKDGTGWLQLKIDGDEFYCVPNVAVFILLTVWYAILFVLPTYGIIFLTYRTNFEKPEDKQ